MIVYPAIDLRNGKVVRLQEGKLERETIFSDDPVSVAQRWIDAGAQWLHMVNLDGAFEQANENLAILEAVAALNIRVQFGGGLRSLDAIQQALDLGAQRVVLGTLAAKDPDAITDGLARFGAERLCVAMDASDGYVTTHGWTEKTDLTPLQFGHLMRERGVQHALYTDVERDGMMGGVNVEQTVVLAQETGLQVIASGGISRMGEIHELARSGAVAGLIIGTALYRGAIDLGDALVAAQEKV